MPKKVVGIHQFGCLSLGFGSTVQNLLHGTAHHHCRRAEGGDRFVFTEQGQGEGSSRAARAESPGAIARIQAILKLSLEEFLERYPKNG